MRVALYARVSTKQHGQDPETQLVALRDYVQQREMEIVGEYVDHGWSGAKESRPQLDRMMQHARRRRFDAVLVWRFDRFARSVRHLVSALEEFQQHDIDFVSMSEQIDTSTPMGKMVFTVMAAVGELGRAIIRENVQIGLARAKERGVKFGRPRKAIFDEEKVRELLASGGSLHSISRQFNVSRDTLRRIRRKAKTEGVESR